MRGGARKGAGRKPAPDMVKICTKISKGNAEWLRSYKGKSISWLIDKGIDLLRKTEG